MAIFTRVGTKFAAVLFLAMEVPGFGLAAPAPDSRVEQWAQLLQESPLPELRADTALAHAARREGLAPVAARSVPRRQLLAEIFPHLIFPDSMVDRMVLSEEFIDAQCRQEREPAQGKAWARYLDLAREIPDSLLPTWETFGPFLRALELQSMPGCRAKLLVKSSPGAFRDDCSDLQNSEPRASGEDAVEGGTFLPWSPRCLQVRDPRPGACLILAGDGKTCQVKVEEFNAQAGDIRIPAVGTLAEGRADLLRAILGQSFQRPRAEPLVQAPDQGGFQGGIQVEKGGSIRKPGTPVRFLASSDTFRMGAADGKRWLNLYLEDLPEELLPLRDSIGRLPTPLQRRTRYGYFRVDFGKTAIRSSRSGDALLRNIEALAQALDRKPAFLEKTARNFYQRWGALYAHPDTLAYTLWLSPFPALDTGSHRSMQVLSTGIHNDIDSLAWKYSAGKPNKPGKPDKPDKLKDTLLGPFTTSYGSAYLRLDHKAGGIGKIPFDSARKSIRRHMAKSLVLGSALGLLQHTVPSDAEMPRSTVHDTPLPRFKDKAELVQEVARLKYGPADAGAQQVKALERFSERMLQEIYRVHKHEKDLGAWMDGLKLAPDADRLGIRL